MKTINVRVGTTGTKAYVIFKDGFAMWGGMRKQASVTNYGAAKIIGLEREKAQKSGYSFADATLTIKHDTTPDSIARVLGFNGVRGYHPDALSIFSNYIDSLKKSIGNMIKEGLSAQDQSSELMESVNEQRQRAAFIDRVISKNPNWGAY